MFVIDVLEHRNVPYGLQLLGTDLNYKRSRVKGEMHTFLGLLAKIECSIFSYQFNI
jgi:hypothetical protein